MIRRIVSALLMVVCLAEHAAADQWDFARHRLLGEVFTEYAARGAKQAKDLRVLPLMLNDAPMDLEIPAYTFKQTLWPYLGDESGAAHLTMLQIQELLWFRHLKAADAGRIARHETYTLREVLDAMGGIQ